MERTSAETVVPNSTAELTVEELIQLCQDLENVKNYVQQNPRSTNTQLFSFLALLNAYMPDSYLLMSDCQKILGPPDPIHGGPPFEQRMEPFTALINTSSHDPNVCLRHPMFAHTFVELLANLKITRSTTAKKFMVSLCGDQPQPYINQFIKDCLTKREWGRNGQEKFSRLIQDIQGQENFYNAVSVLKTASDKFRLNAVFPQTISRLYYIRRGIIDYTKAEGWAKKAIDRAPSNSYVADTLGQVYKNRLMRTCNPEDILNRAEEAFGAFKDVERKADKEEGPEMMDTAATVNISNSFNNRGLFGFIQVAKITLEKLINARPYPMLDQARSLTQKLKMQVEANFDFFEWYLTYSKPDMTSSEPAYFWKDVVLCYELYTTKAAAESTSFPGLLDCLNHGLFTSKGRRAGFEETEKTASDLEAIRDDSKTTYEANVGNVKAAETYILSNIILSNKMHNYSLLTLMKELQTIILNFLATEVGQQSPEFYLLVLLLFWPEEQPRVVQEEEDEEVEQQATEGDGSEDTTWEDEDDDEQETRGESAQLSLELMSDPDLQQQVTFMENAFEGAKYAKYLRGRYLLPLFLLGKGSGLTKWIHKSRLDAIVEKMVDAELAGKQYEMKEKWQRINDMWINGKVWQVPEIQAILLPVRVELCHSPTMPQEDEKQKVFVHAGGEKILATAEVVPEASALSPMLFYLGFTIQGPVIFRVGCPDMSGLAVNTLGL